MAETIRILGVHGLGDHRTSKWKEEWEASIRGCFDADTDVDFEFAFVEYDDIFEKTKVGFADTIEALWKLSLSGLGGLTRRQRGIGDVSDRVRWTAGYVVAWVADEAFQAQTRQLVFDKVQKHKPHVILAHSLGSLITYNAFTHAAAADGVVAKALKAARYVTFGSQIGNPYVVGNLTHGRIQMPAVRHWHHLYNQHDDVFTAQIRMPGVADFSQLLTPFDIPGVGDHAATSYLSHDVTIGSLWRPLTLVATGAKALGQAEDPWAREVPRKTAKPTRKALLVGINEYPREADRLAGCVNDVFAMSAVLQECGFEPGEIRTCLDDRATAAGILSRLEWLLGDAQPGDQLVFYYSGHGARVPEYGEFDEPDRLTETLVPWDFDWTPETSISDEQIYGLYSQLPYETQLMLLFDCCHAGSMHRQSGAKARGISPPDDIRHRQLKWDIDNEMWVDRDFAPLNKKFSPDNVANDRFFGENRATLRLGRSAMLRHDSEDQYRSVVGAKKKQPIGPYLPLIIEACAENELSYEYRHGATSYGAFTFCLASLLREEKNITYKDLVTKAGQRLRRLQYNQVPQILGPTIHMNAKVPWKTGTAGKRSRQGVPGASTPRLSG